MADLQVKDKQLIPSAFNLADGRHVDLQNLQQTVHQRIISMKLTPAVSSACKYLFDQSAAGNDKFKLEFGMLSEKEYKIIIKDFGEISGAAYLLKKHANKYKAVKFPTGNEKLIDYLLVTKDGLEEKFSAKAGQGGKPSIISLIPIIEEMILKNKNLDIKLAKSAWVISHLSTIEKNALYWGPLKAAEYIDSPGFKALIQLLKTPSLKTGYISGLPSKEHLETAVVNCGNYDNFIKLTTRYYVSSGYTSMDIGVTKKILDKNYSRDRYGLLHFPITSEIKKWLNVPENGAQELLNRAANTLNVQQMYLDIKGQDLVYSVKSFSDAIFKFDSPSSVPYPTNNRMGFTMIKSPTKIGNIKK